MANQTDALLTMEELVAIRQEHKVYEYTKSGLSSAICAAQHAKTLRWVADKVEGRDFNLEPFGYIERGTNDEMEAIAMALRALADGRGEG